MPLPDNYEGEWVTAKVVNLDGTVPKGQATFTPQLAKGVFLLDSAAGTMVAPRAITATLDGSGSWTGQIPATNDPDVEPSGWTYLVLWTLDGVGGTPYSISLTVGEGPSEEDPVNLVDKAPVTAVTATASIVRSVNGVFPDNTGNVVVSGGSSGPQQVVTASSAADDFAAVTEHSGYLVANRATNEDDASLVLRTDSKTRGTVELADTTDDVHIKVATGDVSGSETYIDGIIVKATTAKVWMPKQLGVGTEPVEKLHVADAQANGTRVVAKVENTEGAGAALELAGDGTTWVFGSDVGANGGDNAGLFHNGAYPPAWMIDGTNRFLVGTDSATAAADAGSVEAIGSLATRGVRGLGALNIGGRKATVGAPTTGAWNAGDTAQDAAGNWYTCTAGGSPGTWTAGTATRSTFNVKDYGAKGDGTTNDSTAIQAAITAATSAGGGTVLLPPGQYAVTTAIAPANNVSLVGSGCGNTVILPGAGVAAINSTLSGTFTSGAPLTRFRLAHLTVDGTNQGSTFGVGIKGVFCQFLSSCSFEDLVIQNCIATGLGIDFLTGGTVIRNVRALNNGRGLGTAGCAGIGIGTGTYTVEDFVIDSCVASGNHTYGIFTETQTGTMSRGARIIGCYATGNGYSGFGDSGCTGLQYIGCLSSSNTMDGFVIDNGTVATTAPAGQTMYVGCEATANTRYGFSYAPTRSTQTSAGTGNIQYHSCYAWNNTSVGFAVFSASSLVPSGWSLHGCIATGNGGSGVHLVTAMNNVAISGCKVRANGQSSGSSKNGITIAAAVTRLWITNCQIWDDGGTQKQVYAIQVTTGITVTTGQITGNELRGNLTAAVNFVGTLTAVVVDGNPGYDASPAAGPRGLVRIERDTAANWTSTNPTLADGEPGRESDTGLVKVGDGATAWTSLSYALQPYSPSPTAQLSPFLGMLATNGDPANCQSTPGLPTGIALFCKQFMDVAGPITNILLDCIAPDTTVALTGLYVGVYDSDGAGGILPGTRLGVSADFSVTVKALPGSGGKLSIPLVTPTASIARNHKIYFAILCGAQSATPVMTYVGGRNYGTNQAQASDFRLTRSTATNLTTLPTSAPTGSNIEASASSYIWMGAN